MRRNTARPYDMVQNFASGKSLMVNTSANLPFPNYKCAIKMVNFTHFHLESQKTVFLGENILRIHRLIIIRNLRANELIKVLKILPRTHQEINQFFIGEPLAHGINNQGFGCINQGERDTKGKRRNMPPYEFTKIPVSFLKGNVMFITRDKRGLNADFLSVDYCAKIGGRC